MFGVYEFAYTVAVGVVLGVRVNRISWHYINCMFSIWKPIDVSNALQAKIIALVIVIELFECSNDRACSDDGTCDPSGDDRRQ